jgi:hypothetical protein
MFSTIVKHFSKNLCKHVVGIAIILSYYKPPPAAKNIKIGEKRRRGRPSKTKKALLIQYISVICNYNISTEIN